MNTPRRLTILLCRLSNEWLRYKQREKRNHGPFVTDETPDLLPQLAMFARALDTISDYSDQNNKAGMIFGGHLADALHNKTYLGGYPALSQRLHKTQHSYDTWEDTRFTRLPERVRQYAPPEISQRCDAILSGENVFEELGLNEDLSDLSLAPAHMMLRFSNMLHYACLNMRMMAKVGGYPPAPNEASKWTESAYRRAEINGKLAKMLRDFPTGLVHWSTFDERNYWRKARAIWRTMPASYRDNPGNYVHYFRS